MQADIITIGDEILIGQIVDSNSAWIAAELNRAGIEVRQITTVSDREEHIVQTLSGVLQEVDLVLITGGLGPTNDDITKRTLCAFFNTRLIMDQQVLKDIKKLVSGKDGEINELNKKQAEVPEHCKVIRNFLGTAPGMWFEENGKVCISLPGVPDEMKEMMSKTVMPWICKRFQHQHIVHKTVLTVGIPESDLAGRLTSWERELRSSGLHLAYLPAPGMVRLRLSGTGDQPDALQKQMDSFITKLNQLLKGNVYTSGGENLQALIGNRLREKQATISIAESCTGGYISRLITTQAGCSDYFKGALVAYHNSIKSAALGVDEECLRKYGAVSSQVVEQMAAGAKTFFRTDYSIATSGIAGPGGGTEEKPVGTVWIAIATPHAVISRKFQFGKHRNRNIRKATHAAFSMLLKQIDA